MTSTIPSSEPPRSNPRISFIVSSQLPSLDFVKGQYVRLVLLHCNGNQTKAAHILGVSRKTIHRFIGETEYGK